MEMEYIALLIKHCGQWLNDGSKVSETVIWKQMVCVRTILGGLSLSSPVLSSSTVADLNWAASCLNCEMNWSVASQLNQTHSEQGGDHLARPLYHPSLSLSLNPTREPIRSIPTLRNASEMCGRRPLGAKAATPPLTATINLAPHRPPYHIEQPAPPLHSLLPYYTSLPYQAIRCSLFVENNCSAPALLPPLKKLILGQTMPRQSWHPQVSGWSTDKNRLPEEAWPLISIYMSPPAPRLAPLSLPVID